MFDLIGAEITTSYKNIEHVLRTQLLGIKHIRIM